jgi:antitoxin PrlF
MSCSPISLPLQTGHTAMPFRRARISHYRGNMKRMANPQSKVTAQGQISVPAEIRKKLGIGPGSILEWEQEGDKVVVRKAGHYSFEDIHRALFAKPPRPRSLEELKGGIEKYIRDKHARR